MEFDKLIKILKSGLEHPLPGKDAQLIMSPQPVDPKRFLTRESGSHRQGAVLIMLYPDQGQAFFPLIKRPVYEGAHSGQIALPGGKKEKEDPNLIHTALREASEEVGIVPETVEVLGTLTDLYISASNFLVTPVIGISQIKPDFVPEEKEVDRIIQTTIGQLTDPTFRKRKNLELSKNFSLDTPYFEVEKEMVWGATAMILGEFLQILENGKQF